MIRPDRLRVRKPYDKKIDELLKNGYSEIWGFGKAAYLQRLAKKTRAFQVKPVAPNRFFVLPDKKTRGLKKKRKARTLKYSIYEGL